MTPDPDAPAAADFICREWPTVGLPQQMSALPPKAEIRTGGANFRSGPIPDICSRPRPELIAPLNERLAWA
jgi:hypothetical protein